MKCPECQFENPKTAKFCVECGSKLEILCPDCGFSNSPSFKFCGECGYNFIPAKEISDTIIETEDLPFPSPEEKQYRYVAPIIGERKYVTVLFSDLTGYTEMSERLDPEEAKDITTHIFDLISKIVSKYDGFIEKFAGDAVMALFGAATSHEDDPVRAIRAAREIHHLVNSLSPQYEERIERSLSMHSGINTGLVVTGEINLEKGIHGVAGDTINLAARLSSLAKPGEIFVGQDTYHRTEGHFTFEVLEPAVIKGKAESVQIYKVIDQKERPITIHRLSGVRADLIGRRAEITELQNAVKNLQGESGRIFSICGDAGTGKSRLVEEFKSSLDLEKLQWLEGRAYPYAQNIPYFPLIDMLNRVFQIEEGDSQDIIRQKIESGVANLVDKTETVIPYVGSLYSLYYSEIGEVSPEFWKSQLRDVGKTLISALARRAPTVFLLEDLHWADPSFVEFLRYTLLEVRQPAIVLCVYRPTFSLFKGHQVSSIGKYYHEIQLQDLSLSVAQNMLESLLKTETIPPDLKRWVQSKAEGNPFYLEELVNTLIESETLIRDNGSWKLTRAITESDIPSSLHGLISGRFDRLEKQTKRILQEASVIGRDFLYDILKRITELEERIDGELSRLERLDLIRTRSLQPDLEYMFKHALTQEIVYNGLLKKQRREIHEHIAQVMESVFKDRLAEFYETLAHHFARGQSVTKAVDYLVKSGEKSLARYAVEEAHQYFKNAYDILASKEEISEAEKIILIDILNSWGYAYYYLGEIKEFVDLFRTHQVLAESLDDKASAGMFFVWLGVALFMAGKSKDSYESLCKGLELGENAGNPKVVGYACTWLTWTCGELGLFSEGINFGERAQKIAESYPSDQYLFFKSLAGPCVIYFYKGDTNRVFEGAKRLLEYGEKTANSRSKVLGHWMEALGHSAAGDMKASQKSSEKAIEVALDPAYAQFPKTTLIVAYFLGGQLQEAENVLESALDFCEKHGLGQISVLCQLFLAPILIAKGQMQQGTKLLDNVQKSLIRNQRKGQYAISEYILGEVNSQIATGPKPSLSIIAKNIGFLVKNVPFATKKAEEHFNKAIELLKEIGAKGNLGAVYLRLGLLYKASKRPDKARQCISEAINIFQECEAKAYLKQANEALDSLV